jgi:hypothetical protein
MSLLVNPAVGMVPVYAFYKAQNYYYRMLIALRDAQTIIVPEFTFEITKNKSETHIAEEIDKGGLVNIMIGPVGSKQATKHSKEHTAKLLFEIYWRSKDDAVTGLRADELAIEHLYYLAANVEYALTAIYNQVPDNVPYGDFSIGEISTDFLKPQKIGESESVWGLGQVELDITTAYSYDDITLPNLEELELDLGNGITPLFTPNPV